MKNETPCKNSVLVIGADNSGWSIDKDRLNVEKALNASNIKVTTNFLTCNKVFFVWWNLVIGRRYKLFKRFFPKKQWLAVVTNDMKHQVDDFNKAKPLVDRWICANYSQIDFLKSHGVDSNQICYRPFYVSPSEFIPLKLEKPQLCKKLGLDYKQIENKYLIGSFQRDTIANLKDAKWQKNPQQMIDLFKTLDQSKFLLVLAGPRRHFLVNECIKNGIPYLFVGNEHPVQKGLDDLQENNLPPDKINLLYNLVDLYLISSKSEGGPKAVIEAALTKTNVLSTAVGMAPDLLANECIYTNTIDLNAKVLSCKNNSIHSQSLILQNFEKISEINNFHNYSQALKHILDF